MSEGQETPEMPENERVVLHETYTCPRCEFGSMRKSIMTEMLNPPHGDEIVVVPVRVCRTCGYVEKDY